MKVAVVWLRRLVSVEAGELRALLWAFVYFFSILCGYYIIRPIREEMGILGGVENLQWLFLGTFLAMLAVVPLFGWLTSRLPRKRFLPYAYYFFIFKLLLFYVLFESDITHVFVARAFYIWVSVFSLFVVSVFWSLMTDIFSDGQARRLFGFIAAGGSAGALTGPLITAGLVNSIGTSGLLPVAAGFIAAGVVCIRRLAAWEKTVRSGDGHRGDAPVASAVVPAVTSAVTSASTSAGTSAVAPADTPADATLHGGVFDGIRLALRSRYLLGICLLILLYSTLSTFLYFQQAEIIRDSFDDSATRTTVFAMMDFVVNALTIVFQVFLTGRLVGRIGIAWSLAVIPILLAAGFLGLSYAPVLAVIVVVQVLRRAGNYAIMKPAREMLYVVLNREEKYKAKNFIDTAVYRGGDAVSAWAYEGFRRMGLDLSQIALVAVPLAGVWAWVAFGLGKKHDRLAGRELNRSMQVQETT